MIIVDVSLLPPSAPLRLAARAGSPAAVRDCARSALPEVFVLPAADRILFLTSVRNTGSGSAAGTPSADLPAGQGSCLEGPAGADGPLLAWAVAMEEAIRR